jgi:hypothetical protein
MKMREAKRLVRLKFLFKTVNFGQIFKNNQHIHFLVHGHSTWSTLGLHLVRGPRLCKLVFSRDRTMEVGPSSPTMEKAIFHGWTSWCKPALSMQLGGYFLKGHMALLIQQRFMVTLCIK